jgi:long-chain acyl-CoA synthetase
VPQTINYPNHPLGELLRRSATKTPDSIAIFYEGVGIRYADLDSSVDRFGGALQDLGIRKGDRVAIDLPNTPQFVIAYYGSLRIGAVVVACSPLYKEKEIVYILRNSEAKVLICLDQLLQTVQSAEKKANLEHIILTGLDEFGRARESKVEFITKSLSNLKYMRQLISRETKLVPPKLDPREDTALLQYTGGTTGIPKGAMLTHRNLVVNAVQFATWLNMREKEVHLTILPFFHIYGITAALNSPIYTSSTMVIITNPRDTNSILEAIDKYEPKIFCGVPSSYITLMNIPNLQQHKIRSIRTCISGASSLPHEVQLRFEELTGGRLVEGYGLTEASPVTHVNPLDDPKKNRPGSIGIPISDTECRIVDVETGTRDLSSLEAGELLIRGPQVMKGYWNMPEETSSVLRDGWLFTGDIVLMDVDGYFRIVDRKKDMINVAGFKVWPREVEEVLYEHPAIKEAAAIAYPDSVSGEIVKAFIVLKDNCKEKFSASDIIAFCKDRIANYKAPRIVEIKESLPKSPIGKILRRELREA